MEAKRDRRRRDKWRMKQKALRFYPHDQRAITADYLAVCSCFTCGNPRRNLWESKENRLTMQERRFLADPS
ncbi:hypothetical protein [Mesorhizobium shangrilense]|uniref:Uncharacterized protein n=1 Tax=Mesorhizobium shangrilense TaxID=460060 RepID=A0ABV2DFV9_9HYPH